MSLETTIRMVARARWRRHICGLAIVWMLSASILLAPSAGADSSANLRSAVTQVRGASCGPLRNDPAVEAAADNVNQSNDRWLNHTARAVPVPDPLPLLKDLGYGGGNATMVQGAGYTDADSIKGLLVLGYDRIANCSYTDYGVSLILNQQTGYFLSALVLAGA